MVFEDVTTMMTAFNIFGMGIYILVAGMLFAIVRGISKDTSDMFVYAILVGSFATILLFSGDYIKTSLFLTVSVLITVYGLKYLKRTKVNTE